MIVMLLKQLSYAIGGFNSYSIGLMRMVEDSLFGNLIFVDKARRLQMLRSTPENTSRFCTYLEEVTRAYEDFSSSTIAQLNAKLDKFEQLVSAEIPNLRNIYMEESIALKLAKKGSNKLKDDSFEEEPIFPKLFQFRRRPAKTFSFDIDDVASIYYPDYSELLFVQTNSNSIVVFDIFQKKVSFRFEEWPFKINKILVRRNLNFFKVVDPNKIRFLSVKDLKKNSEGKIDSSKRFLESSVMLEMDFRENLFSVEMIKNYFEDLEDKVWFYKDGIVDSYSLILENPKTYELYFFNFKNKQMAIQPDSPKRGNKRDYSLANLKRSVKEFKSKQSKKRQSENR